MNKRERKKSAWNNPRTYFSLFLFFSLPQAVIAQKLTKFEVTNSLKHPYPFLEACQSLPSLKNKKKEDLILLEMKDANHLDCMGTLLSVNEFCRQVKKDDPGFMRGLVNQEKKVVECQTGEQVLINLDCGNDHHSEECKNNNSLHACEKLKKLFAHNLKIFHHSFIQDQGKKSIHCYYVKDGFFGHIK